MIDEQKKDEEKVNVTLVTFNSFYYKVLDRVPIEKVAKLTKKEYSPSRTTALLDAIGKTLSEFPRTDKDTKVIVSITTDGRENASREFSRQTVKKMIEDKQEEGWEFIFVGANMDAVGEAGKLGIRADRAVRYENDSEGIGAVYGAVSDSVRMVKKQRRLDGSWSKKVRDDNNRRQ